MTLSGSASCGGDTAPVPARQTEHALLAAFRRAVAERDPEAYAQCLSEMQQRPELVDSLGGELAQDVSREVASGLRWPKDNAPSEDALARLGPRSIPYLLKAAEPTLRLVVERRLSVASTAGAFPAEYWQSWGGAAQEVLVALAEDAAADRALRWGAVFALGRSPMPLAAETTHGLLRCAETEGRETFLGGACLQALSSTGCSSLRGLVAAASDPSVNARLCVAQVLGAIQCSDETVGGTLATLLADTDLAVSARAAASLHARGARDSSLRLYVERAAEDEKAYVRLEAVGVLAGWRGADDWRIELLRSLRDRDPVERVREEAGSRLNDIIGMRADALRLRSKTTSPR